MERELEPSFIFELNDDDEGGNFERDFEFRGDDQSEFNHTEPEEIYQQQFSSQIFSLQSTPYKI
jgi:hypothetical protein